MSAPQCNEHRRHHRLHTEAHPVHAVPPVDAQQILGDVVGIALDGHLGIVANRQCVEHPTQLLGIDLRGRSASHEDRGCHRHTVRNGELDLGAQCVQIIATQVVAIGKRRERAVVAPRAAERYVQVGAEPRTHGHCCVGQSGWKMRSSASRRAGTRSTGTSSIAAIERWSSSRMVMTLPLKSWRCT